MTDYKLVPVDPTPEMLEAGEYAQYTGCYVSGIYADMLAAAPAVQGEPGVKWAPEEVANGNKGIRWVSDEGVHGRPTDHDCRVYLESNPNARGCHCPECTMLAAALQPAEQSTFTVGTDLMDGKLTVVVMKHENNNSWVIHTEVIQPAEQQPALTKFQPCGCVICTCEHETQCQGCGAKHCGTHPVGQIPGPVYQQTAPDVSALVEAAEAALGEIEDIMQEAYNSAHPVCCGRPGSECCGSPEPEWEETDQRMMDRLAPHQKALREALAAHRKQESNNE